MNDFKSCIFFCEPPAFGPVVALGSHSELIIRKPQTLSSPGSHLSQHFYCKRPNSWTHFWFCKPPFGTLARGPVHWELIRPLHTLPLSCLDAHGYSTIYSLRLWDSRDSQDSETPETPRLPRLRNSRGFCHITFQFSFISDLPLFQIFQILQIRSESESERTQHLLYFWKTWDSRMLNITFPRLWDSRDSRDSETLRLWDKKRTKPQNVRMPDHLVPS